MTSVSENADIAVLQSEMKTMNTSMSRIETKIDNQNANYVTKGEFEEFKKRWAFSHVIVGLVSSILTGLIVFFITRQS